MPKRSKRTIEDRISEYQKKIVDLQQKKKSEPPRKRIRIIYSSSDDENNQDSDNVIPNSHRESRSQTIQENSTTDSTLPEGPHCDQSQPRTQDHESTSSSTLAEPEAEPQAGTSNETASVSAETSLDPDLLMALGESTDDVPEFGKAIHESLASLWLPVLKKGLGKENKENILKKYLIPENCKLLQSPKLNPEISAAVSEIVRGRDKKLSGFQQQLGAGITALNKGMEILLSSDNKTQALTYFSDSCRVLTDLHCTSTKDRIKLITPSLEKNILHVIQDSERDDTLFGNALSEKIKASKAILRQGQQIKNKTAQASTSTFRHTTVNRFTPPGNWRGPPRHYNSRGGRGNQARTAPTRRPYSYNTTSAPRSVPQAKPRAPTQQ